MFIPYHRADHGQGSLGIQLVLCVLVILATPVWTQSTPQDPDYTCSATKLCAVGCCSGESGICGLGPDYCDTPNCINSCDAKSECDPAGWGSRYALAEKCPLNVCCSQYGFCGTSNPEFCNGVVIQNPVCSGSSSNQRTIGYYESWASTRACDAMTPESIPWGAYSHINFAFASINPTTFEVVPTDAGDIDLYTRLTNLKSIVPGLQVWISIGGWTMNDPDQATATTFSDLAGSASAQSAFSNSLISFMSTYGFDGVDIDWEYPVAPERSGRPEDYANYPTWLAQLKGAFGASGHTYGLSITLPSSFWYLRNFDIVKLEPILDWFNMMEYDLHGTWDSTDVWVGPFVQAHTNLTEIDDSLKLMWRNDINPSKVVMGIGFYGRSFQLQDPSCKAAGCPFSGAGPAGECTGEAGTLSYAEIGRLVAGGATITHDVVAAVKIVTWDDYWVSYDDAETLAAKVDYANQNCLGGTMVWAVSTDDQQGTAAKALADSSGKPTFNSLIVQMPTLSQCMFTDCQAPGTQSCPAGFSAIFQLGDACGISPEVIQMTADDTTIPHRYYCCPTNNMPECYYSGVISAEDGCGAASCLAGSVAVLTFTSWPAQGCPQTPQSLCCHDVSRLTPRGLDCFWTDCGDACPADTGALVSSATALDGSPDCTIGEHTLCCPLPLAIDKTTCVWNQAVSVRLLCTPSCPAGKIEVAQEVGGSGCLFGRTSYCCDPPNQDVGTIAGAVHNFEGVAHDFMTSGSCASLDLSKRETPPPTSANTFAALLVPLLLAYVSITSNERPYILPYQEAWDRENLLTGAHLPTWNDLADKVATTPAADLQAEISQSLCTIFIVTLDQVMCTVATCSGALCGISAFRQDFMASLPADITPENWDTTPATASVDFSGPPWGIFVTSIVWWKAAKNLDWWVGSNHGISAITGGESASSRWMDFTENPTENLFTGAGPVWGCTVVAVVSEHGAWTAHFWQSFFTSGEANFQSNVLNFLGNGDAEYLGLNVLVDNGYFGPFNSFTKVVIMTPLAHSFEVHPLIPAVKPTLVVGVDAMYDAYVLRILQKVEDILQRPGLDYTISIYPPDQQIWNWIPVFTGSGITTSVHWTWSLDRSVRLDSAPFTGMLTIQRRAAISIIELPPSVRIFTGGQLMFQQDY